MVAGWPDHTYTVHIVLRFIAVLRAGIQLACWIVVQGQRFFGVEGPAFYEGEELIYRS
jgi:hypothetical protein